MSALALTFQDTQFDVIDHKNQPWLRGLQIASALGYKNPTSDISNLYDRNKDEFTDNMTALVEVETEGGKQTVRIFSLRGCHLLGMLAKTKIAKEFRKWVLDILDSYTTPSQPTITNPQAPRAKFALPGCLTKEQQDLINDMLADRVAHLPQDKQAGAIVNMRSALVSKWELKGVKHGYKNIPEDQFTNVLNLIARLELGGDHYVTFLKDELALLIEEKAKSLLPPPEAQPTNQINGTMILRVENGAIEQCQMLPTGAMMYNPRDEQSVKGLVMHYIPAQQLGTLIDSAVARVTSISIQHKND
jgi:prophage antirepressor-like protein